MCHQVNQSDSSSNHRSAYCLCSARLCPRSARPYICPCPLFTLFLWCQWPCFSYFRACFLFSSLDELDGILSKWSLPAAAAAKPQISWQSKPFLRQIKFISTNALLAPNESDVCEGTLRRIHCVCVGDDSRKKHSCWASFVTESLVEETVCLTDCTNQQNHFFYCCCKMWDMTAIQITII